MATVQELNGYSVWCCKTQELATALCQCWETTETSYINNCKKVFVLLRLERDQIIRYFYNVRSVDMCVTFEWPPGHAVVSTAKWPTVSERWRECCTATSQTGWQTGVAVTQSSSTDIAVRRFSCCAPTVWNSLPSFVHTADSLTSFWSQLKAYMFARHYRSAVRASDTLTRSVARCKFVTYLLTYLSM